MRELGGVARTSTLQRQGISRDAFGRAIERGELIRPQRGWVALPDADSELLSAARWGVVLTCVSAARRHGFWVLTEERPHVACSPHSGAPKPRAVTVHWSRPVVPRDPDLLVDPPVNALIIAASCLPHEQALTVWESAFRQGAVDPELIKTLPLTGRAAAILAEARPYADSGLETLFVVRLRWLPIRIVPQVWIAGHRVDFLLGDRLVVQIDGGHHVGAQRAGDVAHDAALSLRGYHVIRITYHQLVEEWPAVQALILDAIARGLHRER